MHEMTATSAARAVACLLMTVNLLSAVCHRARAFSLLPDPRTGSVMLDLEVAARTLGQRDSFTARRAGRLFLA